MEPGKKRLEASIIRVAGEEDFVVQVWAGGSCAKGLQLRRVKAKGFDDVFAHCRGGCGGKTYDGDGREGVSEVGEVGVGWAEVMAPL